VIIIIIIIEPLSYLVNATFAAALSSSHYPGETAIRIDSYPAGGVFLALTQASPVGEPTGHLWYDSGIAVPISAALPGLPLCQGGQEF
jgi:hypothetical protein